MDNESSPLDATDRLIKAASEAAELQAKVDIEAAATLAETNKLSTEQYFIAKSEASLRDRALTLSTIVTILIVCAQIVFCWYGKTMTVPDIVWVVVLSPWLGAGSSKIITMLSKIGLKK